MYLISGLQTSFCVLRHNLCIYRRVHTCIYIYRRSDFLRALRIYANNISVRFIFLFSYICFIGEMEVCVTAPTPHSPISCLYPPTQKITPKTVAFTVVWHLSNFFRVYNATPESDHVNLFLFIYKSLKRSTLWQ